VNLIEFETPDLNGTINYNIQKSPNHIISVKQFKIKMAKPQPWCFSTFFGSRTLLGFKDWWHPFVVKTIK